MKHALLNYLNEKIAKSSTHRFEVFLKNGGACVFYTVERSRKEGNYSALYLRWFHEPLSFTQKFSSEEYQLTETHLTLDNNKEDTHATYEFENKKNKQIKRVRVYNINRITSGYVTLKNDKEDEENKETFSFEEFKKIANSGFMNSIVDYQMLFESLSKEQAEKRNQLETELNAHVQSFHTLLGIVEKNHFVTQVERSQFHEKMNKMKEIVEEISQAHAGDVYNLSFYEKWNELLEEGALPSEFYFPRESSSGMTTSERISSSSVISKKSNSKKKNKKTKPSSESNSVIWDDIFEEYAQINKEYQDFHEGLQQANIDVVRNLYDSVSQQPNFNSHLIFFFGLLFSSHDSTEKQKKALEINTFFLEEKKVKPYIFLFDYLVNYGAFLVKVVDAMLPEIQLSAAGLSILYGQADILEMLLRQKLKNNNGIYFRTSKLNRGQCEIIGLLNVAEMIQNSLPPVGVGDTSYISDIQSCVEILLKYEEKMSYEIASNAIQVTTNFGVNLSANYNQDVPRAEDSLLLKCLTRQVAEYSDTSRERFMKERCQLLFCVVFDAYTENEYHSPEDAYVGIGRFIAEKTALIDTFEMTHLFCHYVYFCRDFQKGFEGVEGERKNTEASVGNLYLAAEIKKEIDDFETLLLGKVLNYFERLENTEQRNCILSLVYKGNNEAPEFFIIGAYLLSFMKIDEIADYVCGLEFINKGAKNPKVGLSYNYSLPLRLCTSEKRAGFQQELNSEPKKFDAVKAQELGFLVLIQKTIQTICNDIIISREAHNIERFTTLPDILSQQETCSYFAFDNHLDLLKKTLKKAITPVKEMLTEELASKEKAIFLKIKQIIQELDVRWNLFPDNSYAHYSVALWQTPPCPDAGENNVKNNL
ncbi:MAG: hypothetical protein V4496_04155 [Pseudomonadota bacterium]